MVAGLVALLDVVVFPPATWWGALLALTFMGAALSIAICADPGPAEDRLACSCEAPPGAPDWSHAPDCELRRFEAEAMRRADAETFHGR